MIAPDLQRNGLSERRPAVATPPPYASPNPESNQLSAAVSAVRSALGGASHRYPLGVLIATAAVVGVTAGWLVKRR